MRRKARPGRRKLPGRRRSAPSAARHSKRQRGVHRSAQPAPAPEKHQSMRRGGSFGRRRRRGRSRNAGGYVIGKKALKFGLVAGAAFFVAHKAEPYVNALAPTQSHIGIAPSGIVGGLLILAGTQIDKPAWKEGFYSAGGGLVVNEVARQLDNGFTDIRTVVSGQLPAPATAPQLPGNGNTMRSSQGAEVTVSKPDTPVLNDPDKAVKYRSILTASLNSDPNEKVRAYAAQQLGRYFPKDTTACGWLTYAATNDSSPVVRAACLDALGLQQPAPAMGASLAAIGKAVVNPFAQLWDAVGGGGAPQPQPGMVASK